MVIKQNQIRGMCNPTKAGQIIPLVIGILQFLTVTYEYWIDPKHQKVSTGVNINATGRGLTDVALLIFRTEVVMAMQSPLHHTCRGRWPLPDIYTSAGR